LIIAFPIHVWTIVLVMRDFSWVSERTNAWDAIGLGAYGLVFAFVESVCVFLVALLVSLFIPRGWSEDKRLATIFILYLVVVFWAILIQVYAYANVGVPEGVISFFAGSSHPYRILLAVMLVLILPTIVIPIYLMLKSKKLVSAVQSVMEKVSINRN
jgi:hypothetical protein